MRTRESILLEFNQCLNLLFANTRSAACQDDAFLSKALLSCVHDAERTGIKRQELRDYAANQWLPQRVGEPELRKSVIGFVHNVLPTGN